MDHTTTIEVPPGWRQGRGAFGGLVVAELVRAMEAVVGDPARATRSVTAELYGPVAAGPATIAARVLRAGKHVSTVRAELSQGGASQAHAVAILAEARGAGDMPRWNELAPPALPPWRDVAPLPMAGPFPEFAVNFEYRLVDGIPATNAGAAARCLGWVRAREPDRRDAGAIAALCDAWWPVALVRFAAMRPIATIAFTLDLCGSLAGLDPTVPLAYRATAPVCGDGYFLETRELWTADGQLVAVNQQTFAIIA